jgi:hypothetical protein
VEALVVVLITGVVNLVVVAVVVVDGIVVVLMVVVTCVDVAVERSKEVEN